jgi:hypothetical protein
MQIQSSEDLLLRSNLFGEPSDIIRAQIFIFATIPFYGGDLRL